MSNTPTSNNNYQEEIDLSYVFKKFKGFFKNTLKLIFEVIGFYLKFKFIVIGLIITGLAIGFYIETNNNQIYDNNAIVIPNFQSVDYLYDKVETLNKKIKAKDTVFLKKIIDSNYKQLKQIEVSPIIDLFNFASESRENIDVLRILIQNQELDSFANYVVASKHYKFHKLNIQVKGEENSRLIVEKLFLYFNSNEHFIKYKQANAKNNDLQILENKNMISQIDTLLFSLNGRTKSVAGGSFVINNIGNLEKLVEKKQELLNENLLLLYKQIDEKETIKVVNKTFNIISDSGNKYNRKITSPVLLVLLFSTPFFLIYLYKKLKVIAEEE